MILVPWVVKSIYHFVTVEKKDTMFIFIFPFLLTRFIGNQIWISLNRYITAKGKNRIVNKTIEFEQVDRERDWSFSSTLLLYIINAHVKFFLEYIYTKLDAWLLQKYPL